MTSYTDEDTRYFTLPDVYHVPVPYRSFAGPASEALLGLQQYPSSLLSPLSSLSLLPLSTNVLLNYLDVKFVIVMLWCFSLRLPSRNNLLILNRSVYIPAWYSYIEIIFISATLDQSEQRGAVRGQTAGHQSNKQAAA